MNNHHTTSSDNICQLPCFQICKHERISSSQKSELNNLRLSKLSLKKVLEEDGRSYKLKKSISDKNLINRFRCETSRSHKEVEEQMLFRKKTKIENEIEKVDQQISKLTIKYERNLYQLKAVKKELQGLQYI